MVSYRVGAIEDIINVIIPHFDKYPLITQKQADFLLFSKVAFKIKNKEHLSIKGVGEILSLKASMNRSLSQELIEAWGSEIVPFERPIITEQNILDMHWLIGFTEGEGCFKVQKKTSKSILVGCQFVLEFQLSQHMRDQNLIKNIIE